jgi:hypothetical protein
MDHKNGKHGGHMWMMLLSCAVMLLSAFFGLRNGFSIGWLMILACPLIHILMMRGMMGHDKDDCHREHGDAIDVQPKSVE